MNDIEEYFKRYGALADEGGEEPLTDAAGFLARMPRKKKSARSLHLAAWALALCGMAAALMCMVLQPFYKPDESSGAAAIYLMSYRESIEPLCEDIRLMESRSEKCREMQISAVIAGLLDSSDEFAEELDGMDDTQCADAAREYCSRQLERIKELYSECVSVYETVCDEVSNN